MLLEIKNLETSFFTDEGVARAVQGVSFSIPRGKTVGVVGESGCGKSVTAMSVMRLVANPGRVTAGEILLHEKLTAGNEAQRSDRIEPPSDSPLLSGHSRCASFPAAIPPTDLLKLSENEMRKVRGKRIAMIFQEPMSSLNPVFRIGAQIAEAVMLHHPGVTKDEAWKKAVEMLDRVKIPEARQRAREYPHQFSGGMRQRAMIAMALSCSPELLIADEPTTALDVTIQAQILDLLGELRRETDMSIMLITHDLGVISEMADEVVVMYASKVVERTDAKTLFTDPRHPYTRGLLRSRPELGNSEKHAGGQKTSLYTIPGNVPSPLRFPSGCKFHPRCEFCFEKCATSEPELKETAPGHFTRCFLEDK